MYNSTDRNSPSDETSPEFDMGQLREILRQQVQSRPFYQNIAVLGCGYVGSALANYWEDQGHCVTGTTTSRQRVTSLSKITSKVVVMKGDDVSAMQSLLQDQDTVVVSIAPTGSKEADDATYEATYLSTARNLVTVLKQSPKVKQVIYLSSCSVYGDRQGDWVTETSTVAPSDQKSQVILEAEKILLQASSEDQKICILRLGGIYGPDRELVMIFGDLAGMTIPGSGDRFVNWIHLDDIIGAIDFARLNELDGIYNLVDDSQLTVKEQVSLVCSHYHLPPVHWDSSRIGSQRKSIRISNQKIKDMGYELIHPQLIFTRV